MTEFHSSPTDRTGWPWTEKSSQPSDTMPDGRPWPRVSIVTPSYNQAQFLEETIRSVLLQGYPDLEYIIIDGGSTDGSVEIIRRYEPWLAYWVSERDEGQADAINKGWRRSTGEIVGWINSDDVLFPGAVQAVVKTLVEMPEVDLVYGDNVYLDEAGTQSSVVLHGEPIAYTEMLRTIQTPTPQPGCLMRRTVLDKVGFLNSRWRVVLDRDYFVRVGLVFVMFYHPRILAGFRLHANSKTKSERRFWVRELPQMYGEFFRRDDLPAEIRGLKRETMSSAYFTAARFAMESNENVFFNLLGSIYFSPQRLLHSDFWSVLWEYLDSREDNMFLRIFVNGARIVKRRFWKPFVIGTAIRDTAQKTRKKLW